MELTLPELSLSTKQVGSKNSYHLSIEPRKIINFDEIIENKGYSLIHAYGKITSRYSQWS